MSESKKREQIRQKIERDRDESIERKQEDIKKRFHSYLVGLWDFIDDATNEEIENLEKFFFGHARRSPSANMPRNGVEKVKVLALLFNKFNDEYEIERILSYLEAAEYGWRGDEYNLNNKCLGNYFYGRKCCKRPPNCSNTSEAEMLLGDIYNLFFDKRYGVYVLYIFSYCLAAVFSSKLNKDRIHAPFFLQIACDRNSVLYRLIQEIVTICDVNTGIQNECTAISHTYGYCGYTIHKTQYPTSSTAKDIDDLMCNKDIPILIDGHENERQYNALLREVANIPSKRNPLGMRDKFNVLPLFVCQTIKSSFNNVIDMDLSDLEVSTEYLKLLQKSKQKLSSFVLELVKQYRSILSSHTDDSDIMPAPLYECIRNSITFIRSKYVDITLDSANNIGFLHFFFSIFLRTIRMSFSFANEAKIVLLGRNDQPLEATAEESIELLNIHFPKELIELHRRYLPVPTSGGTNDKESKMLAKQIEKLYLELKVYIRITPISKNDDRYVFNVDTLQDTRDSDIGTNARTVQHRLKKYQYFRFMFNDPTTIKLVVAKEPMQDNSLIEILEHENFSKSKMVLPYAMGFDEMGTPHIVDIVELPHLLVGGTTNSGKSTALRCLLTSIAYKKHANLVNVLILDLLRKEPSDYSAFNDQAFMSCPIISDPNKGLEAVLRLDAEMVKRIKSGNLEKTPYIVCVIDEFPRLFSDIDKKNVAKLKEAMTRLLSSGRHAKIHMVLAAQDPIKENMICGNANISAKVAFRCDHYQRSVTILGRAGAEKLIGRGQMIFDCIGYTDKRLQGSYISKDDMYELLAETKEAFKQEGGYPFHIFDSQSDQASERGFEELTEETPEVTFNDKLADVIMQLLIKGEISNKAIKERVRVAYDKANKYIVELEEFGLIPSLDGGRNARKLNPIEKIKAKEVSEFLLNSKDYLHEKNSEAEIKDAFKKLSTS
jgi:S-DNA-T family DNA segregation ATPase FtsK/SpoIIIE